MTWRRHPDCACQLCTADDRYQELLALARKAYELLTPEQKAEHDRAQRVSWVKGTLMLGGLGEEQAEALAKTTVRQAEKEKAKG